MSAICSRCSLSSSTTTTMIDLSARWICKRRYPADQSRMALLLLERFSADFITRTAGRHDRCTFAAPHPRSERNGSDHLPEHLHPPRHGHCLGAEGPDSVYRDGLGGRELRPPLTSSSCSASRRRP